MDDRNSFLVANVLAEIVVSQREEKMKPYLIVEHEEEDEKFTLENFEVEP